MKKQLLLIVAAVLFAAAPPAAAQDTIKIGLMCPLTGSWAAEG